MADQQKGYAYPYPPPPQAYPPQGMPSFCPLCSSLLSLSFFLFLSSSYTEGSWAEESRRKRNSLFSSLEREREKKKKAAEEDASLGIFKKPEKSFKNIMGCRSVETWEKFQEEEEEVDGDKGITNIKNKNKKLMMRMVIVIKK